MNIWGSNRLNLLKTKIVSAKMAIQYVADLCDRYFFRTIAILVSLRLSPTKRKFSMNTHKSDLFLPIRQKLDAMEIHNSKLAQLLCRVIPASCPFESDIKLFGNLIIHIPPLCKLNPLYEQLISLRFRAICYLTHLNSNT